MHHYLIYGLQIRSELELPWLAQGGEGLDVTIAVGDSPTHLNCPELKTAKHEIKEDEILLVSPSHGRVWLRRDQVVLTAIDRSHMDMLVPLLLGSGMAALLMWREKFVMHASAVLLRDGGAIAFAGDKQAGKSTLASCFYHHGHSLVSDDVCALSTDNNTVWTEAGIPRLKLDAAVLNMMGKVPDDYPLLHWKNCTKYSYQADLGFQTDPAPLQAIYLLEAGETHAVIQLSRKEATVQLSRQHFRRHFLASALQRSNALAACIQIAGILSIYRLIRPKQLSRLPDTMTMLVAGSQ